MPEGESIKTYWSRSAAELMSELATSVQGLTEREAAERLQRYGPNSVEDQRRLPAFRLLLRQFESPLVLILVFGALVSLILRDWLDASIILLIVLGSALLGFAQEYRASAAVEELRRRLALTAKVMRDGRLETIAASAIVPGDVIQLSAGNLVPADGVVLAATDFLVSEATLTGESFPSRSSPGSCRPTPGSPTAPIAPSWAHPFAAGRRASSPLRLGAIPPSGRSRRA